MPKVHSLQSTVIQTRTLVFTTNIAMNAITAALLYTPAATPAATPASSASQPPGGSKSTPTRDLVQRLGPLTPATTGSTF